MTGTGAQKQEKNERKEKGAPLLATETLAQRRSEYPLRVFGGAGFGRFQAVGEA